MSDNQYTFKRNHFSTDDIGRITVSIILSFLSILLFMNHDYIIASVLLALVIAVFLLYRDIPRTVVINEHTIILGKYIINWDKIIDVRFDVGKGKDYKDIQIQINERNIKYIIHTKYYIQGNKLRLLFENICRDKSIKYVVRDRGL